MWLLPAHLAHVHTSPLAVCPIVYTAHVHHWCHAEPAREALLTLPNAVITPHIGWRKLETRQRLMDGVAKNIIAFLGGEPINAVS